MLAAILVLLAIAVVAIVGAITSGDGGQHARATPTPGKKKQPKAAATTAPQQTATPDATNAPGPAASGDDPAQLNSEGYRLFQAGSYAESIPHFQKAVDACGDSTAVDPCAYATYNLGAALNRSGHPADAIPVLQQELERWPQNQPSTVRKELESACKASGQECGKPGKGKGKGKGEGEG